MAQKFANAARAELSAAINDTDTAFTVVDFGALFPAANTGAAAISAAADWFKAVLQDDAGIEVVFVRTHDVGTTPNAFSNILRGQEGTTARSFSVGAVFGLRPLASDAVYWTGKQNAEVGKGLSQEDYTTAEKGKLAGIEAQAQKNVKSDWNASSGDAQILNKPSFGTAAAKNVPTSGNAAAGEVVLGNDTRLLNPSLFYKVDAFSPAFTKTGAGTLSVKAGTSVMVAGVKVSWAADTAITMPALTAGTDYTIWVKDDATIQATASFSTAPGAGNWRKIGGFHYAPGGNASAQAGGDTTPTINAYSFWDLKFRPACPDPRGMTLVADSFWADIYLLGVDHLTNGTSKYNVSIADGSAPPKIPTKFGGTGSNAYSTLNWWEANEVLRSWGKRSPTYDEFAALAYGTTEATSSGGSDVPTTGVSGTGATNAWNKFTSRWGVIQATGCMWIWGGEFGGGAAGGSWTANTGGRGSTYQMENAVLLGGDWGHPTQAGSRCSLWLYSPTNSSNTVGARGVCDHLTLD